MLVCPRCNLKYPSGNDRCFVDNEALVEASDEWLGRVLGGRYLIETKIGEGGMAAVYQARHTLVDQPVAVKIMNRELGRDKSLRERFRREAKNAAALEHPNIIEIFDHGETDDGALFMVMEMLTGHTLEERLGTGALPIDQVCSIGWQISRGLARAHDFDVLHRDLKPDNIFLCERPSGWVAKLLDFGIGRSMQDERLTSQGEVFGTPEYMAPERVTSIDAGPSADLYSLGCILYEMVTGKPPFQSANIPGYFIKHMNEAPVPPTQHRAECPALLEHLILNLLAKKPEARPVDAHAVMNVLFDLAPDARIEEEPDTMPRVAHARTLPPATLDRWVSRADVFQRMLAQAYGATIPPKLTTGLSHIRTHIHRMNELRSLALKEQRKLEAIEEHAREGRTRLNYAVDSLGEDLSKARGAIQAAQQTAGPQRAAAERAQQAYQAAHQALMALGGYGEVVNPLGRRVGHVIEIGRQLDAWRTAVQNASPTQQSLAEHHAAVQDLTFQIEALRTALANMQTKFEEEQHTCEAVLLDTNKQLEAHEAKLMNLANNFCTPLRGVPQLSQLFQELEAQPS